MRLQPGSWRGDEMPGERLEVRHFSTHGIPAGNKLDRWSEALTSLWGPIDVIPHGKTPVEGTFESVAVEDLRFNRLALCGHDIRRTPENLSRMHGGEFVLLAFPQSRPMNVSEFGGGPLSVAPGKLYLLDNSATYRVLTHTRYDTMHVMIPLREILARIPDYGFHHTGPISEPGRPGALLFDTFLSIIRELPHLRREEAAFIRRHLLDLLYFTVKEADCTGSSSETSVVWAHRRRILRHMSLHLADPDLSAEKIAEACGMSPSYLHRLFRGSGQTVREHLKDIRLDHALKLLSGRGCRLSMTEVSYQCGFRSPQEFSRAFRGRHGHKPSDLIQ